MTMATNNCLGEVEQKGKQEWYDTERKEALMDRAKKSLTKNQKRKQNKKD